MQCNTTSWSCSQVPEFAKSCLPDVSTQNNLSRVTGFILGTLKLSVLVLSVMGLRPRETSELPLTSGWQWLGMLRIGVHTRHALPSSLYLRGH